MPSLRFQPRYSDKWVQCLVLLAAAMVVRRGFSSAESVTRAESLRIAESFVQHRWQSSTKDVLHGKDSKGVEVHTPDRDCGRCDPLSVCWIPERENIGVAYKWGGNDNPETFSAGIRAGKVAGDVYTSEKRRLGDKGVSADAVGVDCSGFINHCWKLTGRYSTNSFPSICEKLASPAELEPGDIMNQPNVHVCLFVKWLNAEKRGAVFYEAAPYSKTIMCERDVNQMTAVGYRPLRYRRMRN